MENQTETMIKIERLLYSSLEEHLVNVRLELEESTLKLNLIKEKIEGSVLKLF